MVDDNDFDDDNYMGIMITMVMVMMMMMACQHIPTKTKSHHGGEM